MDLRTTVENMFAPARHPGMIGVELELIPVTGTPRPRPVAPARLAAGFGVRLEPVGVNPHHSCADVPLGRPTPRYLAIQRALTATWPAAGTIRPVAGAAPAFGSAA